MKWILPANGKLITTQVLFKNGDLLTGDKITENNSLMISYIFISPDLTRK